MLLPQELFGARALQHGEGGQHPGLDAGLGHDGDRARCAADRPAAVGIENMSVAHAVFHQKAARIAAGGDTAAAQLQGACAGRACGMWIVDAYDPGLIAAARAADINVSAEVDERADGGCLAA